MLKGIKLFVHIKFSSSFHDFGNHRSQILSSYSSDLVMCNSDSVDKMSCTCVTTSVHWIVVLQYKIVCPSLL